MHYPAINKQSQLKIQQQQPQQCNKCQKINTKAKQYIKSKSYDEL